MSSGKEFQRTDAATGNERRPTVDRRNGGTCSSCDDDERRSNIITLGLHVTLLIKLLFTAL